MCLVRVITNTNLKTERYFANKMKQKIEKEYFSAL